MVFGGLNKFEICNLTDFDISSYLKDIKSVLKYALKVEKVKNANFNVIFVDNDYIHKLNKEYPNVDRPTDVISFALEDNKEEELSNVRMLGDIYISIDKAREQALEYGHSLRRELSFLSVHGILHLLGYDHMEKEDEKIMFAKQEEILNAKKIER